MPGVEVLCLSACGSGAHGRCGIIQQVHGQEPMFPISMPKNLSHSPETLPLLRLLTCKHQKPSVTALLDRAEFRPCLLKVLEYDQYATCHVAKVIAPVMDIKAGMAHGGGAAPGTMYKE